MLYVLCCTAVRRRGIFRRIESETTLTVTLADSKTDAMEQLRASATAQYGEKIDSWKLELNVTPVPSVLCILAAELALIDHRAASEQEREGAEAADGVGETQPAQEGAEPVTQPEATPEQHSDTNG